MRKLIYVLCASFAAVSAIDSAYADGRSEQILRQLAAKIEALGDYGANFEVRAEGNVAAGTYAVSGARYYMHTEELDVVCDGKTRWEINHVDKEVLVDGVNPDDGNILSNPTRAFDFAPDVFDSAYKGSEGDAEVVVLTPRDKGGSLKSITLKIGASSGLPEEIRYRQEGLQGEVVVAITRIARGVPAAVRFTFDKAAHKGYEVVDFR